MDRDRMVQDINMLRGVLLDVEWSKIDGRSICPCCGYNRIKGHAFDCKIPKALWETSFYGAKARDNINEKLFLCRDFIHRIWKWCGPMPDEARSIAKGLYKTTGDKNL